MPIRDHLKKFLWLIMSPFFPLVRDVGRFFGYAPFPARQEYHLGWLTTDKTAAEFEIFLKNIDFEKNKIAWIDDDEILSLRLRENFKYQYHLRLFKDREIRGHYELTPEYSPFDHLHDKDTSAKRDEFLRMLSGWVDDSNIHV